jgi:hypothetical protein
MAVEDRPCDEDIEWSLLSYLVFDVDDVGTGDDLVARSK